MKNYNSKIYRVSVSFFFVVSPYDLKHISFNIHQSIRLSLMLLHSKMFTDFLSAFQIHHDLNMCVSSTIFFIVERHIFKSKSPVYVCFESRCLNISNTLKQNMVGAEYYLAGNDQKGMLGRAGSKGSSLHAAPT